MLRNQSKGFSKYHIYVLIWRDNIYQDFRIVRVVFGRAINCHVLRIISSNDFLKQICIFQPTALARTACTKTFCVRAQRLWSVEKTKKFNMCWRHMYNTARNNSENMTIILIHLTSSRKLLLCILYLYRFLFFWQTETRHFDLYFW